MAAAARPAGFASDATDEESEVVPAAWPLEPERLEAAWFKRLVKPPASLAGAAALFSLCAAGSAASLARVANDSAEEVRAEVVEGDDVDAIARAGCEAPAAARGELRLITYVTAGTWTLRVTWGRSTRGQRGC